MAKDNQDMRVRCSGLGQSGCNWEATAVPRKLIDANVPPDWTRTCFFLVDLSCYYRTITRTCSEALDGATEETLCS